MIKTQIPELRREPRDPIARRAKLLHAGDWVPCLIQDMSPHGFGITTTRTFSVGDVCGLQCEPHPGQEFRCHVEVRHASESHVGVVVVEMNENGRRICMQLMRDYHSDRKAQNR